MYITIMHILFINFYIIKHYKKIFHYGNYLIFLHIYNFLRDYKIILFNTKHMKIYNM